jgi:hypothetical protein
MSYPLALLHTPSLAVPAAIFTSSICEKKRKARDYKLTNLGGKRPSGKLGVWLPSLLISTFQDLAGEDITRKAFVCIN